MFQQSPDQGMPFDTLYSEHHGWLKRWLQARTGCSHVAADLAHDAYLRVLRRGQTPAPEQSRRFLVQIAKGLMIDQQRRRRIEIAYLESLRLLPEPQVPSAEEQALTLEVLGEIDALLHELPDKPRRAFLMYRLDGMTYQAVADALKVSVSSVEKYIAKALLTCHRAVNEVEA